MNSELSKLVRYRFDRANETLEEAWLLFDNGHLHAAVNRLYYACFYAVNVGWALAHHYDHILGG